MTRLRQSQPQATRDIRREKDHVKSFYVSKNPFQALWHLPAQIFFAITGVLGLAQYARQIVRVVPKLPAALAVRRAQNNGSDSGVGDATPKDVSLGQWVDENVGSLRGVFRPTWWLPNGHLQTMYSVVGNFSKVDQVRYKRTYLRVPDGGTLGLDFTPANYASMPDDAPTLVICHGLTGGSHESYVRNVVAWLVKPKEDGGMGGRAVVVNFRGCAGVPVTSPQFYSAGTTLDLSIALHYIRATFPRSPLHGIGFSLGAAVLSRYLGESSDKSLLSSGIVLGAPWDLPRMSVKLENHWFITPVYSRAMASNLMRVLFSHYDKDPTVFDHPDAPTAEYMDRLKQLRKKGKPTLKTVDQLMVSKFGGPSDIGLWPFPSADEYYDWASPNRFISAIKRPTLVVNAFDDPIIDGEALPLPEIHGSSHVYGAITGGGGHLGWFEGNRAERRWILRPVSEWVRAAYRDFEIAGSAVRTVEDGAKGWRWVNEPAHEVRGVGQVQGGGGGRLGWKVLDEGEMVRGEEGEGVLQGL